MPPMAAEDGGGLWLLGKLLGAVDADFSSSSTMGVQSQDDTERRTTWGRRNDKGELQQQGMVETNPRHWNDSRSHRNERDLRDLSEPDQGKQGWWFW